LKEVGSLSTRYMKKSSLKSLAVFVFLLLLSSISVGGEELDEEISEAEGIEEESKGTLDLKERGF